MANNLTEYLTQIQELTKKNFELLKALNNAFYTKSEHLSVTVDNTQYVIPSFLSLENKINTLEDNFENLVNAPKTGEAVFNFNGNTQNIEVKGFTNVPQTAFEGLDMLDVANIKTFSVKKNEIFKDFLTPTPYVKIDLSNLPDDIQQLNVKKIAVSNLQLVNLLKTAATWTVGSAALGTSDSICRPISYADTVKKLYGYSDKNDYVEYDKTYTLPIRYELGSGKYRIEKINDNWTDENFFEHYSLKLDKISYVIADETIERNLRDGDYLITNNDKVKLLIESINTSTKTVQVKVENGAYADLCTIDDENVELSTLKFYALGSIASEKYLEIPLEEDRYVLIFLAPIQRNSLIQSAWKDGLFFDVYHLTNENGEAYENYYNSAITNIGDKLFGIVSMIEKDFVNIGEDEYNTLTQSKPEIDTNALKVTLINKHMSNSETVQEIYNLYKQKQDYKTELNSVQSQIDEINELLNSLSFEDASTNRTIYTQQLSTLNSKKKELTTSVANTIQQIYTASVDTDTPVENPKYHIRGFFDYNAYLKEIGLYGSHDVIKIDVQYRYKNANKATGNAETIGSNIYSDWNIMQSETNWHVPYFNGGNYQYKLEEDTSNKNVPSFNQFDIPISQGETVDMRFRVVYAVGYPFVHCTSDWSEITNIEFPVELRKNITVLDILKENNSDTQKEVFRGYLEKEGITDHISDKLVDQNITFFHGPDKIASGFYTDERRVIPLRDKLQTLTDDITTLKDEVYGTSSENLLVTLSDGDSEIVVTPYADNNFILQDFSSSNKTNGIVTVSVTLNIQNNSKTSNVKLFSMFPGSYQQVLDEKSTSKFLYVDYFMNANNQDSASAIKRTYACAAIGATGTTEDLDSIASYMLGSKRSINLTRVPETVLNASSVNSSLLIDATSGSFGTTESSDADTIQVSGFNASSYNSDSLCVPIYIDHRYTSSASVGASYLKNPYYFVPQVHNQWIYFRLTDPYDGKIYYTQTFDQNTQKKNNVLFGACYQNQITDGLAELIDAKNLGSYLGMSVYPHVNDLKDICITQNDGANYKVIHPGEALQVNLTVKYALSSMTTEVSKTICFDIRNSLYTDPLNFKFVLTAKYANTTENNMRRVLPSRYTAKIIN